MARRPTLTTLAVFGLAFLVAGARQAPRDGLSLLQRTAEAYAHAQRFDMAGEIHAVLVTGASRDSSTATFVVASGGPGRMRDELQVPGMEMMRVSDGTRSWTYDGQRGQYVESPKPLVTPEAMDSLQIRQLGGIMGALLNSYRDMAKGADSVSVLRTETLRLEGRPRLCDVVRARYTGENGDRTMIRTYWIDRARALVLRQETILRFMEQDVVSTRTERLTFRRVSVNEPVPESVFAFQAPPGAKRVDEFTAPGQEDLTGQAAADFTLSDLDGHAHKLSAERGKVVMLDFWATWCGPCRLQMPAVDRLYKEFKDKGLVVFAVNQGEPAERARAYLEKQSYTPTALLDSKGEVGRQYQVRGIPTLVIVGRDGTIVAHWVGVHPESTLREGLKRAGIQ